MKNLVVPLLLFLVELAVSKHVENHLLESICLVLGHVFVLLTLARL